MEENEIIQLLERYQTGTITDAERAELNQLILQDDQEANVKVAIRLGMEQASADPNFNEREWREMIAGIVAVDKPMVVGAPVRRMFTLRRIAVAAAVIILIAFGVWLIVDKNGKELPPVVVVANDVKAPDHTKAVIVLADGRTINLDSLNTGTIAREGRVEVIKNDAGEIVYNGSSDEVVYNTLSNPRGSKVVSLTLSDGTKVWLNSESSLRYPVAFAGNTREVEITGEAYFEVAKDPSKKFIVNANGVATGVLGTHFNVNSYADEQAIRVTLLEGSIKIRSTILKPGQQAAIIDTKMVTNNDVDVEQVMAWKNGLFKFNSTDIQTMLREAARWYDIKVNYPYGIPDDRFGGSLSRNVNLSEFVKILEYSDIKVKIEGRNVTIMK